MVKELDDPGRFFMRADAAPHMVELGRYHRLDCADRRCPFCTTADAVENAAQFLLTCTAWDSRARGPRCRFTTKLAEIKIVTAPSAAPYTALDWMRTLPE